jgi:hypothetical protein
MRCRRAQAGVADDPPRSGIEHDREVDEAERDRPKQIWSSSSHSTRGHVATVAHGVAHGFPAEL